MIVSQLRSLGRVAASRAVAVAALSVGLAAAPGTASGQAAERPGQAAAVAAAAAAEAPPADTDRAVRTLMRAGVAAYRKHDHEAARAAFAEAWALRRHRSIAASLAEVEMKLGRFREAAEHWAFYLDQRPPDRADAEAQLRLCRAQLGFVRVTVDLPLAVVTVDGRMLGPVDAAADLPVEPGPHVFAAAVDGRAAPDRTVVVVVGETQAVTLTVGPPVPVPPVPAPEPPVAGGPRSAASARQSGRGAPDTASGDVARTWALIGGTALTAAAVGVGVGYRLHAAALEQQADQLRGDVTQQADPAAGDSVCSLPSDRRPAGCDSLLSSITRAGTARTTATVAFVTGGVLGAATVAAYLLWPTSVGPARGGHVAVTPWDVPGGSGMRLTVTF